MSNGEDSLSVILAGGKKPSPQAIAPPNDALSGILSPAAASDTDPLGSIFKQAPKPPPFAERHPLIQGFLIEPMKQVSKAIVYSLTGTVPGEPEPTREFGSTRGTGDVATTLATEGPTAEISPENMADVRRGTALLASFAGGPIVESLPAVGPLLGHWGSFLTGEFLGGSIYGAIRPTEEDETRAEAILGDAATFATFGAGIRGAGEIVSWGLKRYILRMQTARKQATLAFVKAELDKVESSLASGGVMLDQLPPDAIAKIEEPILRQAVEQSEPAPVNIDAIVSAEANREIETAPRFDATSPLRLTPPVEITFKEELEKLQRIPGTEKGFEVVGKRKTPRNPEHLIGPAVRGKSNKIYVGGATHAETIERAIASGVPEAEFAGIDLDHPGRGFKTNERDFISREEAAKLVDHPEPLISEDMHHRGLTSIESPAVAELKMQNVAKHISRPAYAARHGTEVDNAVGVIREGLRPGSSVSLRGGRDYEGYPVTIEFKKAGATTPYSSPLGPTAHEAAATTGRKLSDIQAVYLDTGDFTSREDAQEAYQKLRQALDETGRKDVPVEAAKFNEETESYTYGGDVSFEKVDDYATSVARMPNQMLSREAGDVLDSMDAATQAKDESLEAKYERRADIVAAEMDKRGLLPKIPGLNENAMMDAATDHAVASIEPLKTAAPPVKEAAAEIADEIHRLTVEGKIPGRGKKQHEKLENMLTAALSREGPAVETKVMLNMTEPGPRELELGKRMTPHEVNYKRELLAGVKEDLPPISIEPLETVTAPDVDEATLAMPKKLDGFEIAGRFNDEQLNKLADGIKSALRNKPGRVTARMLLLMTGSGMEWLGYEDDGLSPGQRTGLKAVGGMLIAASLGPRVAKWAQENGFARKVLSAYNPMLLMNDFPKGKEAIREYVDMLMEWRAMAHSHGEVMDAAFPDEASNRAAMFVADEGQSASEWHTLTPDQQREAMAINQFNLRLGQLGKANGILDAYRENYVRHLLPPESFEKWRSSGFRVLPTSGTFTKQRIFSLRDLEAWAQAQGVPGPIMKMSTVHSYHMNEFSRALAGTRLRNALEKSSLLMDMPKSSLTAIPVGWRPLKGVLNLPDKMAPDVIATALENIASPKSSRLEVINSLDKIKSLWMRSIMLWFWEHGFNAMRSFINLSMNPRDYADAFKYMRATDAIDLQGARYGLNLYNRPDYGVRAHNQMQDLLTKVGTKRFNLGGAGARADRILEIQDRLLWDKMIPSLQKFTYAMEMSKWTERTGGKFLEGSAEFTVQARKAADFANTVAGRVPRDLQDPELSRGMRLLMFSPQWTMGRLSIIANAAGEAGQILSGELNPRDAMYLPFKMRQLAWGIALTYLGSKIMSGKPPQFNEKSLKFYMRTGLRDPNGREIGLDVIGWWQDDLKLFSDPFNYMLSRANPAFKVAGETLTGRDYLGRSMTPGQRVGNLLQSFGPPTEIAADAVRVGQALTGGRPIRGAEGLQMATRVLATARTSTLDRPMDAAIAKYAKKLLIAQGIPANDDNIFELSRLLRGNALAQKDLIDSRVINMLAYKRRGESLKHPAKAAIESIWQESRRVLADF